MITKLNNKNTEQSNLYTTKKCAFSITDEQLEKLIEKVHTNIEK